MAQPIDLSKGFLQTRAVDAFGADTGGRAVPHTGWDWAPNKPGAALPVYAVEAGTVFYVGGGKADRSGPGINVRIHQPSGYWLYGHLSRADVRNGQAVRAGQQIGLMGSSGGANGVHLHISRFTTKAAALANAIPTQRAGRSVAAWASANRLADPMEIINPPQNPPAKQGTTTGDDMLIIHTTAYAKDKLRPGPRWAIIGGGGMFLEIFSQSHATGYAAQIGAKAVTVSGPEYRRIRDSQKSQRASTWLAKITK